MASRKTAKNFVEKLKDSDSKTVDLEVEDVRLAAAVLLVHASAVDGAVDVRERLTLHDILERGFELDAEQLGDLIARADEKEKEALDLDGYADVLTRKLDKRNRMKILEMLFEVINADGIINDDEGKFASRVEHSLGITPQDWAKARQEEARGDG